MCTLSWRLSRQKAKSKKKELPLDTLQNYFLIVLITFLTFGCKPDKPSQLAADEITPDGEVVSFMESFAGRGDLTDDTKPTSASDAVRSFILPEDLNIELVLAEPDIFQPVEINFDHRGRLWVVQYNQYPYPEGLKVTSVDHHLRVKFDKVPEPPPGGTAGADKITFFEDTNSDGIFDKATDAVTGLNIATSVILGRGKIWVLNPPYLLAYPDPDDDGIPNGPPEVHLRGFGLEDTHAVANSLTWGPDGWIYGAQGSTTTANISSEVSKNVGFLGQAIWRYHPESRIFEIFAEGGGNTFDVEIDAKGRIYSGDNGTDRGQYYKQGAYYTKNWGKHGPHTNPYSLGFLANMALDGDRKRFTHAWIKYEGAGLPQQYQGKMIAINPLQSYVQLTRFEKNGSTFKNVDESRILETPDHWFRPVDIKAGPDGNVYLADWYDSRLSHVDPRDTWHKQSGRIYRLSPKEGTIKTAGFNFAEYPTDTLIHLLSHPDKWIRQQVQNQFANRRDAAIVPKLIPHFHSQNAQTALEALWAINLSGGFTESLSIDALTHQDPYVRMWAARLLGDQIQVTRDQALALTRLAQTENHPEVRSQLAATAKRLESQVAIPMIEGLLENSVSDPDIPLQVWWALESKSISDRKAILQLFENRKIWESPIMQEVVLSRLTQRYIMAGTKEDEAMCVALIRLAPSSELIKPLLTGLLEGIRGRDISTLSKELTQALEPYASIFGDGPLALGIRQGQEDSIEKAISILTDPNADLSQRIAYVRLFGETTHPVVVPHLLDLIENQKSSAGLRQAALLALTSYNDEEIGERVSKAYPDKLRADPDVRTAALSLLVSRPSWTTHLLDMITLTHQIDKKDLTQELIMGLSLTDDPLLRERIEEVWPETRLLTKEEKDQQILKVKTLLSSGTGNPTTGRTLFKIQCGACHKLYGEGADLAPELTSYDRRNLTELLLNIVDPHVDIREGYVNHQVRTKDNRTIIGTIVSRQGDNITLKTSTGGQIVLHPEKIKEMVAQKRSLMPERLLDGLPDQQIRDLFAYLMQEP